VLAPVDWTAPDEEEEKRKARAKRENPIPEYLRDIFEKDAKVGRCWLIPDSPLVGHGFTALFQR
jgi:hypothetical protein